MTEPKRCGGDDFDRLVAGFKGWRVALEQIATGRGGGATDAENLAICRSIAERALVAALGPRPESELDGQLCAQCLRILLAPSWPKCILCGTENPVFAAATPTQQEGPRCPNAHRYVDGVKQPCPDCTPPPVDEKPGCETCGGTRTVPDPRDCDCIMADHCHGPEGKDGKRCRLRRRGTGGEGDPGISTRRVPCPDCSTPEQVGEGGCERCSHIAAEALAMAEELEGQPLKRRYRSVEEIKREFFPALHAQEQKAAREAEAPSELKPGARGNRPYDVLRGDAVGRPPAPEQKGGEGRG